MRKRLLVIALTALMISALPISFVCAAGGSHGEDARSQSMSTDTGEEPITDMSVTQDPGAEDQGVLGDLFGDMFTDIPWKTIGMGAGAVLLLIILIVIIRKIAASGPPRDPKPRRSDRGYKARH